MRSRTIAIAGSIAALSFAATPVAIAASSAHHPKQAHETRADRSRDKSGAFHRDKSRDTRGLDSRRDIRDR